MYNDAYCLRLPNDIVSHIHSFIQHPFTEARVSKLQSFIDYQLEESYNRKERLALQLKRLKSAAESERSVEDLIYLNEDISDNWYNQLELDFNIDYILKCYELTTSKIFTSKEVDFMILLYFRHPLCMQLSSRR